MSDKKPLFLQLTDKQQLARPGHFSLLTTLEPKRRFLQKRPFPAKKKVRQSRLYKNPGPFKAGVTFRVAKPSLEGGFGWVIVVSAAKPPLNEKPRTFYEGRGRLRAAATYFKPAASCRLLLLTARQSE